MSTDFDDDETSLPNPPFTPLAETAKQLCDAALNAIFLKDKEIDTMRKAHEQTVFALKKRIEILEKCLFQREEGKPK